MSFFETIGKISGGIVAKCEQMQAQINLYRPDYEDMSNNELKKEYQRLKPLNGEANKAKLMTVRTILKERGVIS
jgi:preprotein translocase subunit SecA